MDTPNATFSPESGAGATLSGLPVGPTPAPCGPDPVLASLSPRQAKEKGLLTSGIYGLRSSISCRSALLAFYLGNRLRQRMASGGSTLFALTWKARVTPLGLRISALRASGLRTSGSGCTSWPTTAARDYRSESATDEYNKKRWGHSRGKPLSAVVTLVSWISPQAKDWRSGQAERYLEGKHSVSLNDQVTLVSGKRMTKSGVSMEGRGRLNPAHSRWLMGFPTAWDDCAAMVTPSSRRSRKPSSKAISKSQDKVTS